MTNQDLSLFSYEILGLVGREGAGAHDLRLMARRGRMLDWAGESQYYVEPKRLARLGYLDARKEPGRTRERTVYTLTDMGLEALREYAERPVRFQPLKSDLLVRLLIADLVGEAATKKSVASLREELAELREQVRGVEEGTGLLPHRAKYLLLVCGFLNGLLDLHEGFIDEVEGQLG